MIKVVGRYPRFQSSVFRSSFNHTVRGVKCLVALIAFVTEFLISIISDVLWLFLFTQFLLLRRLEKVGELQRLDLQALGVIRPIAALIDCLYTRFAGFHCLTYRSILI